MNDLGRHCLAHRRLALAIAGHRQGRELTASGVWMRRRAWRNGTVSAVGFGCMSFGGFYGPTTEAESMRAMARALELGVDFWDTANVYGEGLSEALIGKFLAEDRGRRAKVTLATKFAIRRGADGTRFYDN